MSTEESTPNAVRLTGLVTGPILAVAVFLLTHASLGREGAIVAGLLVLMATWWLTIAVDLAVTALLPVLLLPLLGVGTFARNAAPYAGDVIFLFGAGFVLSTALERSGLSRQFAGALLRLAGRSAPGAVAALMVVTAAISGFVSNTATAAAMLPIGLAATLGIPADQTEGRRRFAAAKVLGIAYAASIGGALTIIGSPPNAVAAEYIREATGEPISFARWMTFGAPLVVLLLPLAWLLLTRLIFPIGGLRLSAPQRVEREGDACGRRAILAIFLTTVAAWLTRPLWGASLPGLGDSGIALGGALLLLVSPRRLRPYTPLVSWSDLRDLPWGVLILFGGGLSLAEAIDRTGVAAALAQAAGPLAGAPLLIMLLVLIAVACFASEIASNTALAGVAMPIVGAIAVATGQPVERLAVATALGASMAFMLPVGTPPNAMAYSTGHVRSGEMARAGLLLNVAAIAMLTLVMWLVP